MILRYSGPRHSTAGLIDGFLDSINPLDNYASVPDIGPIYGHTTAYTRGYVGGGVVGIGAQIYFGNVGALGLCGTKLGMAISLYNEVEFVGDMMQTVESAVKVAQGNGGWMDFAQLAMTAVSGSNARRGGCFVGGTQVVMADPAPAGSTTEVTTLDIVPLSEEPAIQIDGTTVLFAAACVPLAIAAGRVVDRKRKREQSLVAVLDQVPGDEAEWEERPRHMAFGWENADEPELHSARLSESLPEALIFLEREKELPAMHLTKTVSPCLTDVPEMPINFIPLESRPSLLAEAQRRRPSETNVNESLQG